MNHIMLLSQALTHDHRGSSSPIPGQTMWSSWRTKWHWNHFFSIYHKHSILIHSTPRLYNLGNWLCR